MRDLAAIAFTVIVLLLCAHEKEGGVKRPSISTWFIRLLPHTAGVFYNREKEGAIP